MIEPIQTHDTSARKGASASGLCFILRDSNSEMLKQPSLHTLLALTLSVAFGCASPRWDAQGRHHQLTQVSTINALMLGRYDGFVSLRDLECQGDFGLGTFDHLAGEM